MAATAPVHEARSSDPAPFVPEEKFWKRYSPNGEAPLSLAGSFALHALAVGGLGLFALYVASLFFKPTRSLPVETVRLELPGGKIGDRSPRGGVPGDPVGDPSHRDPGDLPPPAAPLLEPTTAPGRSKPAALPAPLEFRPNDLTKAFDRLEGGIRDRLPQAGERGSADKARPGSGDAPGPGRGDRAGKLLKPREKRMLRWHMRFTANNGGQYLAQLRDLGAILAFPVREGPDPAFKAVEDLRPGGKLIDKDLSRLDRIYWIDDKSSSVRDLLAALRLTVHPEPKRFVAFMPKELEEELFRMERTYAEKVRKLVPFDEDRIRETNFQVVRQGGRYRPKLIDVTLKE